MKRMFTDVQRIFAPYKGSSKSKASYLFPGKLQEIARAKQQHYLIEQILSYQTLFLNTVTAFSFAFSPARKNLHQQR